MKKIYEKPEIKDLIIDTACVISTSNVELGSGTAEQAESDGWHLNSRDMSGEITSPLGE